MCSGAEVSRVQFFSRASRNFKINCILGVSGFEGFRDEDAKNSKKRLVLATTPETATISKGQHKHALQTPRPEVRILLAGPQKHTFAETMRGPSRRRAELVKRKPDSSKLDVLLEPQA